MTFKATYYGFRTESALWIAWIDYESRLRVAWELHRPVLAALPATQASSIIMGTSKTYAHPSPGAKQSYARANPLLGDHSDGLGSTNSEEAPCCFREQI